MAYPSGINNGVCPSSHPVHLISIFFEIYFSVDPFNKLNDGGIFVVSTGDSTGYSLHGDFYNGWDQDILQQAVDQCTNDSGVLEDCGVFTGQNLIITDDAANSCSAIDPVGVPVDGVLDFLPNCVAIQDGPQEAKPGVLTPGCTPVSSTNTTAPKSSAPTASSSQANSVTSGIVASTAASSSVTLLSSSSAASVVPTASTASVIASSAAGGEATSVLAGKTGVRAASTAVPTATTEASAQTSSAAAVVPSALPTEKSTCSAKSKRDNYKRKPSVHHYRQNANRRSF